MGLDALLEPKARANPLTTMRATLSLAFAAGALLLAGCQDPDVGQPCNFPSSLGVDDKAVTADFFESGNPACENLICVKSPPPPSGCGKYANATGSCRPYCSKPCVSNNDCAQGETGLVCRPVVLDDTFLNWLAQNDPDSLKYLGDETQRKQSSYCALPLP